MNITSSNMTSIDSGYLVSGGVGDSLKKAFGITEMEPAWAKDFYGVWAICSVIVPLFLYMGLY